MKVAITGGIGSGKSYVCKLLAQRGIAVYDCDMQAKSLISASLSLQQQLSKLIGREIFVDGKLQKAVLAQYLLADAQHTKAINDIVHPAVAHHFEQSGYDWIESAIFFDSGFDQRIKIDKVVCVTAPDELRIARVMLRDHISEAKAHEWFEQQLSQDEVVGRSNYRIINDGVRALDEQITTILAALKRDNNNENNNKKN